MIFGKGPWPSVPGNLIGGADAPETEGGLMKFPTQIPQIPPEDNFSFNENEKNISEGEDPPIGLLQNHYWQLKG
jgi:hypothetical protein